MIIISYFWTILTIISTLLFTLNTNSQLKLYSRLQSFCENDIMNENVNIKANINNVIIISIYILSCVNNLTWNLNKTEFDDDIVFTDILIEEFNNNQTNLNLFKIKISHLILREHYLYKIKQIF